MSTYRTGNQWGVTIVREGGQWVCSQCGYHNAGGACTHCGHLHDPDQLVAVVVNGDQALAERICKLLNGYEQQVRMVDHGRQLLAGYDCPDHPGPLDDARDHVCRLRPVGERP